MRRLVYAMLTSLDMFVEGADGTFGWAAPDEELHRHFNERAAYMTTHLYGRRMWETMSSFWPTAASEPDATPTTREFARLWNAGEHVVFSRTLEKVEHGARLVSGDAIAEIRRLKGGEGTDLEVSGPGLAQACVDAGLVDEIHAYMHPVLVRAGKPFLAKPIDLALIGTQTFAASGVVQLRFRPKR